MAKKKKFHRVEMVVHGVLSYPDLANPKPYKGKIYYRTDVLFDQDDPQLAVLKKKINSVRVKTWGDDKEEWPDGARKRFIQDGNEREDQPTYADKSFITVSTQQGVSVVDPKGKPFSPQMVKGGMSAKVAINISPWDNDGEEGMSIYLQAVMVDPSKERLPGFGGGKSAKKLFGIDEEESDESEDADADDESDDDEEEDQPRSKKKKAVEEEDEDNSDDDEDEGEEEVTPKKKKKSRPVDEEDED